MEIILILFAFVLTIGATKAQDTKPSFEETVNYLNNILKENEHLKINFHSNNSGNDLIHGFIVEKNGKVIAFNHFPNDSYNKEVKNKIGYFDLFEFDHIVVDEYPVGVVLKITDSKGKVLAGLVKLPSSYSTKLEKAFKHLRTFCSKEKDPFE